MEITGRDWHAIRTAHAECHQRHEGQHYFSPGRFDVLFVLRPGTDSRSRERTAERFKNIREILSCLFKARHLLRAIAVCNRVFIHSTLAGRCGTHKQCDARSIKRAIDHSIQETTSLQAAIPSSLLSRSREYSGLPGRSFMRRLGGVPCPQQENIDREMSRLRST